MRDGSLTPPSTEEVRSQVLVTSAWFEPGYRGGGPIRSVAQILDTAPEAVDIVLVTSDRDLGDVAPYDGLSDRPTRRGRSTVHYVHTGRLAAWWRVLRDLRGCRFDLLYVNSLFDPKFSLAFLVATGLRLISVDHVLIAPRGELAPGALDLKPRKKRVFLAVAKQFLSNDHVQWHATSALEAAQVRRAFPGADVLVVEVQTSLPAFASRPTAPHDGPLAMVFLSRISPKKNLLLVLRALGGVTGPASLDIYGPIEDAAYWQQCRSEIERLPSHVSVVYRGEVAPGDVRSTFSRYDVFVFPTLGENFGHVIAESLSAACPVVCSGATPWTVVLEGGGGAVLSNSSDTALAAVLNRLVAMGGSHRHAWRRDAGDAYEEWRRRTGDANVIREWLGQPEPSEPSHVTARGLRAPRLHHSAGHGRRARTAVGGAS